MKLALLLLLLFLFAACAVPEKFEKKGIAGRQNCVCIALWDPVCGEDGKTYSNSCFAECAGVSWKPGACA